VLLAIHHAHLKRRLQRETILESIAMQASSL